MPWIRSFLFLMCYVLFSCCAAWSATPTPPDVPDHYVVDLAGVINPRTQQQLNALLRDLEQKTGVQMAVLTVQTLDGEDIDGFSLRTAEQWKLGEKGKDNGLLLTVAVQDRKYRFEVGYGLESILPDSRVGTIGRRSLVPYFKQGQYSQGIASAVGMIAMSISKTQGVELAGLENLPKPVDVKDHNPYAVFVFILILLFIIYRNMIRNNRRSSAALSRGGLAATPFLFGSGWSGGGGFGGGGFGGGLGGGFGGGGASGGW